MSVEPGWYKDPADPSTQRYWDGEGWIGPPLPADATPPPGPPALQPEAPAHPAPSAYAAPAAQTPPTPAAATGPAPGWGGPGYGYLPPPRPHGLPLAPLGARLAARLIDIGILLGPVLAVNGWFLWQWGQEVFPYFTEVTRRALAGDRSTEGLPQPSSQADFLFLAVLLITAAIWLAYEVPAVATSGQTIGKRLIGVKVLPLAGDEQVGIGRSLRRWNMVGLPIFLWGCCGLGLLLQLVDCGYVLVDHPLRQALHDKRAQTVVVQVPRQPLAHAGRRTDPGAKTPGGSA